MRFFIFSTFLFFSSFSGAADYSWRSAYSTQGISYGSFVSSSASASCKQLIDSMGWVDSGSSFSSPTFFVCRYSVQSNVSGFTNFERSGDSCPSGATYDETTGGCITPPACPAAGTNKLIGYTCDCSGKYCISPGSFSFEGCGYEKNIIVSPNLPIYPPQRDLLDPANSMCFGIVSSTGQPLAPGESVEEVCPDCIAEVPNKDSETPSCVTTNAHEFCPDPDQPNCGTRDGNPYCFNETDACGKFNDQMICIPSSGGRTCSYASGKYVCIDKTTGKVISDTSSDHPSNGGNADGNDKNDAQAPGSVVTPGTGSAQGSDEGATNKAITDLQGALTDRLDDISDLLGEGEPSAKNINAPTETGSIDLDEWDKKIEQAKIELKQSSKGIGDLMNAANNWIITGSGGSLSCFVEDWGRMCLADYQDHLIGIRYVLIFMASILAIYIIFIRD